LTAVRAKSGYGGGRETERVGEFRIPADVSERSRTVVRRSKTVVRKDVRVRIPLSAPTESECKSAITRPATGIE